MPAPLSSEFGSHDYNPAIIVPSLPSDTVKACRAQESISWMQANNPTVNDCFPAAPCHYNQYWAHRAPGIIHAEYTDAYCSSALAPGEQAATHPSFDGAMHPTVYDYSYGYWNGSDDSLQVPSSRTGSVSTESINRSTSTLGSISAYSGSSELLQPARDYGVIEAPAVESHDLSQERFAYTIAPSQAQQYPPVQPYHPSMGRHNCHGDTVSIVGANQPVYSYSPPRHLMTPIAYHQPQYAHCHNHIIFEQPPLSFTHNPPICYEPPALLLASNAAHHPDTVFSWNDPIEHNSQFWQPPLVNLSILHPIPRPIPPPLPPVQASSSSPELASGYTTAPLNPEASTYASIQRPSNPLQPFLHAHHFHQEASRETHNYDDSRGYTESGDTLLGDDSQYVMPPLTSQPPVFARECSPPNNSPLRPNVSPQVETTTESKAPPSTDKAEHLRRPWPTRFEEAILTPQDLRLPASKRRRIYINSLEQYCNQLHQALKANNLSQTTKPPAIIQNLKEKDTKLSIVKFQHEIFLLRNKLTHLNTKQSKGSPVHPHAKTEDGSPS